MQTFIYNLDMNMKANQMLKHSEIIVHFPVQLFTQIAHL